MSDGATAPGCSALTWSSTSRARSAPRLLHLAHARQGRRGQQRRAWTARASGCSTRRRVRSPVPLVAEHEHRHPCSRRSRRARRGGSGPATTWTSWRCTTRAKEWTRRAARPCGSPTRYAGPASRPVTLDDVHGREGNVGPRKRERARDLRRARRRRHRPHARSTCSAPASASSSRTARQPRSLRARALRAAWHLHGKPPWPINDGRRDRRADH